MKFKCYIKASFEIPDGELRAVVEQHRKNWAPDPAELFPHDLINTARNMGIGTLSWNRNDPEVECDEAKLEESDIPDATRPTTEKKGSRRARRS